MGFCEDDPSDINCSEGLFMLLLHARNIKKFYGERLILQFDDLKIYYVERIGIVDANGSGKTTLLDLLAGRRNPDEGCLDLRNSLSYIRQEDGSAAAPDRKLSKEFMVSDLDKTYTSGGEKTRLQIASSFNANACLLFADEPTTNLDLAGIKLLEEKLAAFRGAMLLVSHDRSLLDRLCRKIIEIRDARLLVYQGNYSDYLRQREAAFERQLFDYRQYIREKNRLEETLDERRGNVKKIRKTPKRMGNSEARLHKRESTEIQGKLNQTIKTVETRLEKLAIKEKPKELPKIKININPAADTVSKTVASGREINLYFGSRCIFYKACFETPKGKKTALMGTNCSGKTTLANLIVSESS
jgi:macrolide transport system ATP-binding/permease protein